MPVAIPRPIVNQLLDHARRGEGKEVCGLIAGRDGTPTRCQPVPNIAACAEIRYEMEPTAQIAALRSMRERNEELFAIYHSHPASPATPSVTDVNEAGYPEALYLIISLSTKGVLEMRGFRIRGGAVTEEELEIA